MAEFFDVRQEAVSTAVDAKAKRLARFIDDPHRADAEKQHGRIQQAVRQKKQAGLDGGKKIHDVALLVFTMTTPYSVEKCGETDDENDPQSRCVEIGRDAMGGERMDAVELRPLRGDHEKQDEIGRDEHHHPAGEMEGGHAREPPYDP